MPSDAFLAQQFKPGQSGNLAGRPRKRPQSEANEELLRSEVPEIMRVSMNKGMGKEVLKKGACWADAIAYGLARKAVAGDSTAAKELRESVEGKSLMRFEVGSPGNTAYEVKVTFETPLARFRVEDEKKTLNEPIDVKPELPASEDEGPSEPSES